MAAFVPPIVRHRAPSRRAPVACAAPPTEDYYPEVKRQYAGLANVRIFAKEDYHLPVEDAPFLFDLRGRDIAAVRAEAALRTSLHSALPHDVLLPTDMHTDEELADFRKGLERNDPTNGRAWKDRLLPHDIALDSMAGSGFQLDPDHTRFRRPNPTDGSDRPYTLEELNIPDLRPVVKRYSSEEQEILDLNETLHRMDEYLCENAPSPDAFSHNVLIPEPSELDRWREQANARGGNATDNESYFLPPFSKQPETPVPDFDRLVPHQHHCFRDAHVGVWRGHAAVFELTSVPHFSSLLARTFSTSTDFTHNADANSFSCHTAFLASHDRKLISQVSIPAPRYPEALVPGSAVSADGHYVVVRSSSASHPHEPKQYFTLSDHCVQQLANVDNCYLQLEIALVTRTDDSPNTRHRILLCTDAQVSDHEDRKAPTVKFSHVIVLSESIVLDSDHQPPSELNTSQLPSPLPVASVTALLGSWTGNASIFQPEYPPIPYAQVSTTYSTSLPSVITDKHVTWEENTIPESPDLQSKRRERTKSKKTISKRVTAARAYDRERLSKCQLLTEEQCGQSAREQFAWKAVPSMHAFSTLQSPRIGHFVGDYCGMLVSDTLLVTFPLYNAFPELWNTVSVTELTKPSRRRIVAGRNQYDTLVGVLFTDEVLENSNESDAVAAYV